MSIERPQSGPEFKEVLSIRRAYCFLAQRAYSVIMFGALFCTLAVKLFHSARMSMVNEYPGWVLADIAVLLGVEVVLAAFCFRWPKRWVIRTVTVVAAVICTWSVMNAGWLIRTGTQLLPTVLLPLIRAPLNSLSIIGVNLAKMPKAAVALLGPSAIALAFFFSVLARPQSADYNRKQFVNKIFLSCVIIFMAILARAVVVEQGSAQVASEEVSYNCQLRAVTCFLLPGSGRLTQADLEQAKRKIPAFDQIKIELPPKPQRLNHNLVLVVLEGIQYSYTSLAAEQGNPTPYLAALAQQGVEFANTRSSLTHTTKVLFSLLTGRLPSVSQDIAEAVPSVKPYASLATILKGQLDFRTAFFQSAKGDFECRPGLVYNLGFDKFWARDDLNDPNAFLGSLGCDEFSMLKPIIEWIKAEAKPFFLTVLCSVTHDPYEVPEWFAEPAKEPMERYRQAVFYTDKFIAALDVELAKLNLTDKTILCVVGDHGEAFGEHGLFGHERIAFEEALRIPWVLRARFLVEPATKVTQAVSSIDLAPTLLALLGFDTSSVEFDGVNALGVLPQARKVYFSGWMRQSPTGFVKGNRKFIYNPTTGKVFVYDVGTDPLELIRTELDEQQAQEIMHEIITWQRNSIFQLDQQRTGKTTLFDSWLCRWNNRVSWASYQPKAKN